MERVGRVEVRLADVDDHLLGPAQVADGHAQRVGVVRRWLPQRGDGAVGKRTDAEFNQDPRQPAAGQVGGQLAGGVLIPVQERGDPAGPALERAVAVDECVADGEAGAEPGLVAADDDGLLVQRPADHVLHQRGLAVLGPLGQDQDLHPERLTVLEVVEQLLEHGRVPARKKGVEPRTPTERPPRREWNVPRPTPLAGRGLKALLPFIKLGGFP